MIRSYGKTSGQQINFSKSSIMFESKVNPLIKAQIKRVLGIDKERGMMTYLGLPEKIHGSETNVSAFVREGLNSRINTWLDKFLSKSEKKVLIKLDAQTLPTYFMSYFLLRKSIRSKLNSAISNFWRSTKQDKKENYWIV